MPDRVTQAVREAQAILACYAEPGPRNCQNTSMICWPFSTMSGLYGGWRRTMSDSLTKRDHRDRSKINMHADFEVKYISLVFRRTSCRRPSTR